MHRAERAADLACDSAGKSRLARSAMMAMTISSSMSVNAHRQRAQPATLKKLTGRPFLRAISRCRFMAEKEKDSHLG